MTTTQSQKLILLFILALSVIFGQFLFAATVFAQADDVEADEEVLTQEELEATRPTIEELNRISELAEKHLSGTITAEESAELQESGTNIQMLENQQTPGIPADRGSEQVMASPDMTDIASTNEVNSLRTMLYGLAVVNGLLVLLFSMYIWRRRHIASIIDPIE